MLQKYIYLYIYIFIVEWLTTTKIKYKNPNRLVNFAIDANRLCKHQGKRNKIYDYYPSTNLDFKIMVFGK